MSKLTECKKLLIEVNQTCNLNCTYCFYRDYGRNSSSLKIEQIIESLDKYKQIEEFYITGGECFTSPDIEKIIQLLSSRGKVVVFTNGIILNEYDDERLLNLVNNVDRFIISFDSFDYDNYICRKNLNKVINVIEKILTIDSNKVEVKVCINLFNMNELENIFKQLISLGVKYLSVNFIFDINNSKIKHEINTLNELNYAFNIIYKYKEYFNINYIDVLYDLYINNKINEKFPCLADKKYFYLNCENKFLICPGNCNKLGERGEWQKCYSKECANEWEIMYMR